MEKNLAVFDFDHTVILENSDVVVMHMIDNKKIPLEVKKLHKSDGWTAFMQGIFNILFDNSIKKDDITEVIENLEEVPGMCQLIKELNQNFNFDVIIISDSNSFFINTWLNSKNIGEYVLKVFTNNAQFDSNGCLKINMYHYQENCILSTKNLCKGQIMEDFIEEQYKNGIIYKTIVYSGDGFNDFCPILRLKETDLACVRSNFKCSEIVKQSKAGLYQDENGKIRQVVANVFVWNTGTEILDFLKKNYLYL